ncbi:Nadh:flavin oxidoreductase nadh oxidase [Mycena sanguinolenta]|uniref:Nadh:flavin oxidoreductase nadh oxidase n=1 Tax=Mycena sanguinolenta TaxID=230812 RepID=A0A8H7DGV8_9AGAR|nr:Nadh:flavin oxidoreductase nadh oxidase [Mycena sanguinolenta]
MSTPNLFQPTQIGDIQLAHRVVMAPATRYHVDDAHTPVPLVGEYYEQRASTLGSLLISEATLIAQRAAVGAVSSLVSLAHPRRRLRTEYTRRTLSCSSNSGQLVGLLKLIYWQRRISPASSPQAYLSPGGPKPRPLTVEEIKEFTELYAQAAINAVQRAGFDGVEIHSANGYLIDQSLHPGSNLRTDAYGGSIENRVRFAPEVTEAVVKAVGQKKTAFRTSPWGTWQEMHFDDPLPTYAHLVTELRHRYPNFAYIHAVKPRANGGGHGSEPFISGGGYNRASAIAVAGEKGDLKRNYDLPDLPYRLIRDIALTVGDRALYCVPGSVEPKGYTDYAFASPVVPVHA